MGSECSSQQDEVARDLREQTRRLSVASDALNHASIIDGLRLSKGQRTIMPHADSAAVPAGAKMVVVEGLYSMDGDVLPLDAYTGEHWLAVDEAHAFGVLGPDGKGAAAAQGVVPDFVVGTLGKAIGAYGAFVVGPPSLREVPPGRPPRPWPLREEVPPG